MRRLQMWLWSSALLGAIAGCDCGGPPARRDAGVGGSDTPGSGLADSDADGIPDQFEGPAGTDTDRDGTPDVSDADSDGDGIPDSIEGGNPGGRPRDADSDGMPDFRDEDADGNGIPDREEGAGDADGDRIVDANDTDDDSDSISDRDELGGMPTRDTDADGTPDHRDTDSDNDTISDRDESSTDTDGDEALDRYESDSDGDTIPDAAEAGDADLATPPIDTDMDRTPDYRDPDADNDGLSDRAEAEAGTSATNADSDGDGVSDLIEVAAGTDPRDGSMSPRTRGDFVFLEPHMAPADPRRDTLDFATNIQQADVYFLLDTTGSMGSSRDSLRAGIASFIPRVRMAIPDVWVGVGHYQDYPVSPYGGTMDRALIHCGNVTGDAATAVGYVTCYNSLGWGNDEPESAGPALWAVATGMPLPGRSGVTAGASCPPDRFGFPCFRSTAVPIVVLITDNVSHNGPPPSSYAYNDTALGGHAPTHAETVAALNARNIRVITVQQNNVFPEAETHLRAYSTQTGAVDAAGQPLFSRWSSGAISDTVLNQIQTLARQTRLDISVRFEDDASDAVETFAAFVDHIEANTAGDSARGCEPRAAVDTNGDGFLDTFRDVTAGTRVCFDIIVKDNVTVPPTLEPQLFRATLQVIGDGFTPLDDRDVFFLVPPRIPEPGGPS